MYPSADPPRAPSFLRARLQGRRRSPPRNRRASKPACSAPPHCPRRFRAGVSSEYQFQADLLRTRCKQLPTRPRGCQPPSPWTPARPRYRGNAPAPAPSHRRASPVHVGDCPAKAVRRMQDHRGPASKPPRIRNHAAGLACARLAPLLAACSNTAHDSEGSPLTSPFHHLGLRPGSGYGS